MTETEVARVDAALAAALPAGSLYAVGGRVRDEVRSVVDGIAHPLHDLDYVAVGIGLDDLLTRLRKIGRTELVGARFAVLKTTIEGTTVDVALPRRERSTGVGHREFDVQAGPDVSLEEDLARRDFRMNMLARALPSGRLVDPHGGEGDVRHRRVDLLHERAFAEDPLRMLRACQFAARFEYSVTERTLAAMRRAAALVLTVSPERIRDELVKLLSARRPSLGFEVMRQGELLAVLLPEIARGIGVEQNEWHAYDVYRHTLATLDAAPVDDPTLRLAALLHDVAKPQTKDGPHFYRHEVVGEGVAGDILGRLRFPNDQVKAVAHLVRAHMYVADPGMTDKGIRKFVQRVGSENLERLFALRAADIVGSGLPKRDDRNEHFQARVAAVLAQRPAFSVNDLAIAGDTVREALVDAGELSVGSRGGPAVGEVLRELLERVIEDPTLNEPGALEAVTRQLIRDRSGRADNPEAQD
jgi:tRNA nucleotidyltransferase (CCA-adding enzyme)